MKFIESATNEELVKLLQEDMTNDVFEELFQRFIPLFHKTRASCYIPGFQLDDYLQEGRIILYESVLTFDFDRKRFFASFFQLLYKNHIYNNLRQYGASKRGGFFKELALEVDNANQESDSSYNYLDIIASDQSYNPEQVILVREQTKDYFEQLSKFERRVLWFYLETHDLQGLAAKLDLDEVVVRNGLDRCRRKLRTAFEDDI